MPSIEWTPATASELSRLVTENYQQQQLSYVVVGGRTSVQSASYSASDHALLLTSSLNKVIDYPARDMTITVEAGIRIEELRKILQTENQQLPIDITLPERATLGGAIAINTSGPRRFGYGTFRDYLIGVTAVDGQGRTFSAGGKVVKNVAGYDFCKLLIGSRGSLATITQVTLKLRPLTDRQSILLAAVTSPSDLEPVLQGLNLSETRPTVIDVLNPKAAWQLKGEAQLPITQDQYWLWIEYAGTESEVRWQLETVQQELKQSGLSNFVTIDNEQSTKAHEALVEFQSTSDDPLTFHLTYPKSRFQDFLELAQTSQIALQLHAGNGIAYGHLPDSCTTPEAAQELIQPIRQRAEELGGALTVLNCDAEWSNEIDYFGKRGASWKLMQRIKQTLDPAGLMLSPNFL